MRGVLLVVALGVKFRGDLTVEKVLLASRHAHNVPRTLPRLTSGTFIYHRGVCSLHGYPRGELLHEVASE